MNQHTKYRSKILDWLTLISSGIVLILVGGMINFYNDIKSSDFTQKQNDKIVMKDVDNIKQDLKKATSERIVMKLNNTALKINQQHIIKEQEKINKTLDDIIKISNPFLKTKK